MGPLEIEIERMDTPYPSYRGKELEIREPETDHEIEQALGEMTHGLAMKDLWYNTSHWCYMNKTFGSVNYLSLVVRKPVFGVSDQV